MPPVTRAYEACACVCTARGLRFLLFLLVPSATMLEGRRVRGSRTGEISSYRYSSPLILFFSFSLFSILFFPSFVRVLSYLLISLPFLAFSPFLFFLRAAFCGGRGNGHFSLRRLFHRFSYQLLFGILSRFSNTCSYIFFRSIEIS